MSNLVKSKSIHANQSTFIQFFTSESGIKIRNRNILDEEPCWSDTDLTQPNQRNLSTMNNNYSINNNLVNPSRDDSLQLKVESCLKSKPNDERYSLNINSGKSEQIERHLGKKYDISNLIKRRSRSNVLSIDENLQQHESLKNSAFSLNRHQNQDEDISGRMNTNLKKEKGNSSTIHQNEQIKLFKNRLAKIAKIKIKMQNFYKNFTQIYRSRQLNKNIRQYIHDLSDIIPTNNNSLFYVQIYRNKLWMQICKLPLLDPQSSLGFTIKSIYAILNFLYFFLFSIFIIFQIQDSFESTISQIIIYIWAFEIVVKTNFKVYKTSHIIMQREEILFYYLKKQFLFDVMPLIITLLPKNISSFNLLQLIQFFKIHNLILDIRDIQLQLCMKVRQYYLVQLFNLIVKLFLIGHIISLLWYLLGIIEQNYLGEQDSWFQDSVGKDGIWWKLYLSALYWSLTLMTTGSNTSTTLLQTLFTSFIMLFTSISFAYILNVIGVMLSEMDEGDANKRRDISMINEYMRSKNISK